MKSFQLPGVSIGVRVRLQPVGARIPRNQERPCPEHVIGFTPGLDETYMVETVTVELQQRLIFCPSDEPCQLIWHSVTAVPPSVRYEEEETAAVRVNVRADTGAPSGTMTVLDTRLRALRRQEKFSGVWIDLPDLPKNYRGHVSLDCVIL